MRALRETGELEVAPLVRLDPAPSDVPRARRIAALERLSREVEDGDPPACEGPAGFVDRVADEAAARAEHRRPALGTTFDYRDRRPAGHRDASDRGRGEDPIAADRDPLEGERSRLIAERGGTRTPIRVDEDDSGSAHGPSIGVPHLARDCATVPEHDAVGRIETVDLEMCGGVVRMPDLDQPVGQTREVKAEGPIGSGHVMRWRWNHDRSAAVQSASVAS
jgi:hypothetical protein